MDDARDASPAHIPRRRRRRLVVRPANIPTRRDPRRELGRRRARARRGLGRRAPRSRRRSRWRGRRRARPRARAAHRRARRGRRPRHPLDPLLRVVGASASPNASSPAPTRALARDPPRTPPRSTRRARPFPWTSPLPSDAASSPPPRAARPWDGSSGMTRPARLPTAPLVSRPSSPLRGDLGGVDAARVSRGPGFESHRTVEREANHTLDASSASVTASSAVMRDGPAYLLVPGLYGRYYPCYMWGVRDHFRSRGAVVKSHPPSTARVPSSVTPLHFAARFSRTIARRAVAWSSGTVKGAADAAAALALYESELSGVVRGLVASQCPYGGSPIASTSSRSPALGKTHGARVGIVGGSPGGQRARKRSCRPCAAVVRRAARVRVAPSAPTHVPVRQFPHRHVESRRVFSTSPRRTCVRLDTTPPTTDSSRVATTEIPGSVAVRWSAEQDHADCVYPRRVDAAALDADRRGNRASREGGGGARGEGGGGARERRREGREEGRETRRHSRFRRVRRTVRRRTHGRKRARAARGGEGVGEEATLRGGRRRRRRRERIGPERPMPPAVGRPSCARARRSTTRSRIGYEELRSRGSTTRHSSRCCWNRNSLQSRGRVRGRVGAEEDDERVEECLGE